MKKVLQQLAISYNCETGYAGSTRTLYVKGNRAAEFRKYVRDTYPTLAFDVVVTTDPIPTELKNEGFAPSLPIDDNKYFPELKIEELKQLPAPIIPEKKEATREEVDAYLIANPVDRSSKNPYDVAAQVLGRSKDYIRDRYRKLRVAGKVENETVTA